MASAHARKLAGLPVACHAARIYVDTSSLKFHVCKSFRYRVWTYSELILIIITGPEKEQKKMWQSRGETVAKSGFRPVGLEYLAHCTQGRSNHAVYYPLTGQSRTCRLLNTSQVFLGWQDLLAIEGGLCLFLGYFLGGLGGGCTFGGRHLFDVVMFWDLDSEDERDSSTWYVW